MFFARSSSNVVLGFQCRSFFALLLSVMSVLTSLGLSLRLSVMTGFSCVFVCFFMRVSVSFIFHVLLVPMLIVSPSMFSVVRFPMWILT